jgi:hypothetical protein
MKTGRPVKYKTPKDIQKKIDQYFEDCISKEEYPTITGLALALDLTRQGLIEYQNKEDFSDTIKKAKLRVEAAIEQRLFHNNPTGCIFNLKNNFGWRDKIETEHSGSMVVNISHEDSSVL